MKDFDKLTLNELKEEISNARDLYRGVSEILSSIFEVKHEKYSKDQFNQYTAGYLEARERTIEDKLKFINLFILNTYPENQLREIKERKESVDSYMAAKQEELAKAFEALQKREEQLNRDIQNHLINQN